MPLTIRDSARSFFNRNLPLKLLSLALALCVWAILTVTGDISTRFVIPLRFKNIPPGYAIGGVPPSALDITVEGPPPRIHGARSLNPAVVLDLAGAAKPGATAFTHLETYLTLPRGVTVTRVSPSYIEICLEAEHSSSGDQQ